LASFSFYTKIKKDKKEIHMGKSEEESENVWREEMGKFGDS